MEPHTVKVLASQAYSINKYKNIKLKLLQCNANIHFNKQCLQNNVIQKYAQCKVPRTSPATKFTKQKINTIRIKDEIKFLYKKKNHLNRTLYEAHLIAANTWGNTWEIISNNIHENIKKTMTNKYKSLEKN
jgi:hypothetical protein